MKIKVQVPINYEPRGYQLPFLRAMDGGVRRACLVFHRRSGKTKTVFNFTIKEMVKRVGGYYHFFPEYGQGRKVIWDGIDQDGQRILERHLPLEIRKSTNQTEMKIELVNGSFWQVIGADNYNSLVGPNPVGLIFDEWAVSDKYPKAWDYFRPILAENKGWAIFPFTPRGRNHGWTLYQMAMTNPSWFCQLLTVDDTKAISQADIQAEREAGMSEEMIQQEFYCDFLISTESVLIPFRFIQGALNREVDYSRMGRIAGLDPAWKGKDRTAFGIRQGGQIIHLESWSKMEGDYTAGRVIDLYRAKMFDAVGVDSIGFGGTIYSLIKNAGVPCVAVNVCETGPNFDKRFYRLRDKLWWSLREWFAEGMCSISSAIAEKDRNALVADIQDIHYGYTPTGQIEIESKDEMRSRLGFSPDYGDAICNTFAPGIEMKLSIEDRIPFGHVENINRKIPYNPLTFGLDGDSASGRGPSHYGREQ